MPVIGIRCSGSEFQIIIDKFGSSTDIRKFLLEYNLKNKPEQDTEISQLSDISNKLNNVLEILTGFDKKKVVKKVKNEDFILSDIEFREKSLSEFKQIIGNNDAVAADLSFYFCNYWLEETKSGEPLWKTKSSWKIHNRVITWIANNRSNTKFRTNATNRQSNTKVDERSELDRINQSGRKTTWS
jgi:hypothetical protein